MSQVSGRRRAPKRRGRTPPSAPTPIDPRVRYGTVPLRFFLGATFLYAGLQKLTDSGFLNPDGATYIGRQLTGYARSSPIGGILTWLGQNFALEIGVLVILTELAIGVGVLIGLWTRGLAVAGALLSLLLFLSATWSVQPYFLGSDSIYTVAWLTLALVGDRGVFVPGQRLVQSSDTPRPPVPVDPSRRAFLLRLGAAGVGAVWLLALLPRGKATVTTALSPATSPTATTPQPSASPAPSGSPGAAPPTSAPSGTKIGTLADLQSAGSLTYQDPASGDPAVAVSLGGQSVAAYDAVCTHAGCTVQYDPSQRLLVCPCHGAAFDPAHAAQVVNGPAPTPLSPLPITVTSDGTIYTA